MGIFDRLFGSKSPPPPSVPPNGSEALALPDLPARAVIATYVLADQVGTLRLESGVEVRFGRSACRGFEPVEGARAIVEEVAPSPRGLRAKTVRLDVADEGYDRLIAERDAAAGLPPRTHDAGEAAATAGQLALATVLLREPLPEGVAALQRWAERMGLAAAGVRAHTERDIELSIEGEHALTYPGRKAFPSAGLDTRDLPEGFDWGRSFVGLGTGIPGMDRLTRKMRLGAADDWSASGRMRRLSKIVRALAQHGTGVVIHRAGGWVVPAEDFVRLLGDLDHPDCRPFAAWIDVAITPRGGEKVYASFGMDMFGLPDVAAPVVAEDPTSRARAHEAVLFACYRMVRENRELAAGETLEVPVGVRVGAWPVKLDRTKGSKSYVVEEDDDLRWLRAS